MRSLAQKIVMLARPNKRCSSASRPKPTRVTKRQIKQAVDQAMLLCHHFEDTIECRHAWELAEELSHAYHAQEQNIKQGIEDEQCFDDPRACREYDV
jgi:alpha-mannosidase